MTPLTATSAAAIGALLADLGGLDDEPGNTPEAAGSAAAGGVESSNAEQGALDEASALGDVLAGLGGVDDEAPVSFAEDDDFDSLTPFASRGRANAAGAGGLDAAERAEVETKLRDVNAKLARQVKVLDGVTMVRSSFAPGTDSFARADAQYNATLYEIDALETQRAMFEELLGLPPSAKLEHDKRRSVSHRPRVESLLRPGAADGGNTAAALATLTRDQLIERLRTVTAGIASHKKMRLGLAVLIDASSPGAFKKGTPQHADVMRQLDDVDGEMIDLVGMRQALADALGWSDAQVDALATQDRLAVLEKELAKANKTRAGLASLLPTYKAGSKERAGVEEQLAACDASLAKLRMEETRLRAVLGTAGATGGAAAAAAPAAFVRRVTAVYAYEPMNEGDLRFAADEVIGIVADYGDGWCEGVNLSTNERGVFPASYVQY